MRTESSPNVGSRWLVVLVTLIAMAVVSGCKTENDPDDPTIIGRPAPQAFLGVEYFYNFGTYGGETILDYSLSNAPSWLALEDTANKARQGIIMRGVPGLTGGNRGKADLGTTKNVTLLTTDGKNSGLAPFDIEVRQNVVSMEADEITEDELPQEQRQLGGTFCELPDLGEPEEGAESEEPTKGRHQFETQVYADDGSMTGTEFRTKDTVPVLVKVQLDQPSVTSIKIAFELSSQFDETQCDREGGLGSPFFTPPHQRCTHSNSNRSRAIVGEDIVGLGSASADRLPVPDYLDYIADESGQFTKGVVTLEPGITDCYIRLEVVSDDVPEATEAFAITLTEVRQGLAALGDSDKRVRLPLQIRDNESQVAFETLKGNDRDVLNAEKTRAYVAKLIGRQNADAEYWVRLGQEANSTAKPGEDYEILTFGDPDKENTWLPVEELAFAPGENKVKFRVRALNGSQLPLDDDKLFVLNADGLFQSGREFYAAGQDEGLRLTINELVSPLKVGDDNGFVPTDATMALNGQIAIAGIDKTDAGAVVLVIHDRKGNLLQTLKVADVAGLTDAPPVLHYNDRSVEVGNTTILREEIAVAYGTRPAAGEPIESVLVLLRYDTALDQYVPVWTRQKGPGDMEGESAGVVGDAVPKAVRLDSLGRVFVAGETGGAWPENTLVGGIDTYVQRIDTELDGNVEVPALAWSRQVGSGLDDQVHSLDIQNATAQVTGSSAGSVGGEPQLGGTDFFFYSVTNADDEIAIRQQGTDKDDDVFASRRTGAQLWLAVGPNEYTRNVRETSNGRLESTLSSRMLNSPAASILKYSAVGVPQGALTLNDRDDAATDRFQSIVLFDSDVIAGGRSDGLFDASREAPLTGETAILARVREKQREALPEPDEEDSGEDSDVTVVENDDDPASGKIFAPGLAEKWRVQPDLGPSSVLKLLQYRDDKIISLVRQSESWQLVLFSGEGRHLNPPAQP
ncbi:hypothetical protein [Marinobacter sp.]|uniref:hypothetical protein n=1 Tax=Marinobacter sp. TaxID=50741 RepID=UPI00384CADF8